MTGKEFDKSKYWKTQRAAEAAGQVIAAEQGQNTRRGDVVIAPPRADAPAVPPGRVLRYIPNIPPALENHFVIFGCGYARGESGKAWVLPTARIVSVEVSVTITPVPEDGHEYVDVGVSVEVFYTSAANTSESIFTSAKTLEDGAALYKHWTGHDLYADYDLECAET